jgi:PAS domain S-box-containing protein
VRVASVVEAADAINQRIFETSLDLILVVDRKGTFIRVSPSAETILGYRPDELVGRSAREFLLPADLDSTRNEMRMARRGRLMPNFECRYMHKGARVVPLAGPLLSKPYRKQQLAAKLREVLDP